MSESFLTGHSGTARSAGPGIQSHNGRSLQPLDFGLPRFARPPE